MQRKFSTHMRYLIINIESSLNHQFTLGLISLLSSINQYIYISNFNKHIKEQQTKLNTTETYIIKANIYS